MVLENLNLNLGEANLLTMENMRLKKENQKLIQENMELAEDLEDMKNVYLNYLGELNMLYQSLEEELDERAKEISQLKSTIRDREEYNDFKKPSNEMYEEMLKAFVSSGII